MDVALNSAAIGISSGLIGAGLIWAGKDLVGPSMPVLYMMDNYLFQSAIIIASSSALGIAFGIPVMRAIGVGV